jgi:3-dehydroquinate synthase
MPELRVSTPGGAYPVHVGAGLLERADELIEALPGIENVFVLADGAHEGKEGPLLGALARGGARVVCAHVQGERSKSVASAEALWARLAESGFHRNDLLVAFGGGVAGDLAGFVAATYHRGMPWAIVPTTLLAMVDSSIGGKTAIDLPLGKNLVGAFHQPVAVIADVATLGTLPDDAFATGMAEVVKHGLIDDLSLLERLDADAVRIGARDHAALAELVTQAAAVKVRIVNEDETERGARAYLNYGHTLGHALEALGGYTRWTHGQAIAIGMMFVAHLAPLLGYADRVAEHADALRAHGLPLTGAQFSFEDVAAMFARDKKYEAGMRFVVLEDLGKPAVVRDVPEDALRAAYEKVR